MIKPFNFVTVGTGHRTDPQTKEPIIPMMPYVDRKRISEVSFLNFIDYKTGKEYPNENSLDTKEYWKPMSEVFLEYGRYNETKLASENAFQRKHLVFGKESVKYIGKEINELEPSTVLGVSEENSISYENQDEKIRRIIDNLSEEKAKELGISRRTFLIGERKLKKIN